MPDAVRRRLCGKIRVGTLIWFRRACFSLTASLFFLTSNTTKGTDMLYAMFLTGKICTWMFAIFMSWKITKHARRLLRIATTSRKVLPYDKAVFIAGCDRGIGKALAKRLCRSGYFVYAGFQCPESEVAMEFHKRFPFSSRILGIDLANENTMKQVVEEIQMTLRGRVLWAIVNTIDLLSVGESEWGGLNSYRRLFDFNVFGLVGATLPFLPILRQSKGRVLIVTNMAGHIAFPGYVPYSMSMHAVVAFSQGLRKEMEKFGVKVITIMSSPFSKTSLGPCEYVNQLVESSWQSTPQRVQNDYGGIKALQDFKDAYATRSAVNSTPSAAEKETVEAMERAITDKRPRDSYNCSELYRWILLTVYQLLPRKRQKYWNQNFGFISP